MIRSLYTIIVNWNLKDDLLECISTLLSAGAEHNHIIVVDNGSTDDSVDTLQTNFGTNINLIENQKNLGFAGGNNIGIRYALAKGANWIFLLNNDTVVSKTLFKEFFQAIQTHSQYSILSPLILDYYEPNRIWFTGNRLIPGTLITYSLKHSNIYKGEHPGLIPVDFVTGCAMLVKANVFREVGLFNPDYFMYAEDVEFCWRARLAGHQFGCVPSAKIWHKVSTSAKKKESTNRYYRVHNQIDFYRKYAPKLQLPIMLIFTVFQLLRTSTLDLFSKNINLIFPSAAGFFDGWFHTKIWHTSHKHGNNCL